MTLPMLTNAHLPILGFAARSGAGRTLRRWTVDGPGLPMLTNAHLPILGFAAWSGTGRTRLLRRLVPCGAAWQTGRNPRC